MTGSFLSNTTSTNSLFSLDNSNFSSLVLNDLDYYYQTDEITEKPLIDSFRRDSILTFDCNSISNNIIKERNEKIAFILVGLPASGKSTISSHLIQYLKGNELTKILRCSIFNAGKVRRSFSKLGSYPMKLANNSSDDLFNPKNSDKKEKYARITLQKLFDDIDSDNCDVAIFDATNSTIMRRKFIFDEFCSYNSKPSSNFHITPIIFQVACSNKDFVKYNIHNKSFNEDYFDKPYEYAISDFAKRLKYYYSQFTPFNLEEYNEIVKELLDNDSDHGLYYFSVTDAGLASTDDDKLCHYDRDCSEFVRDVIDYITHFVDNYTILFGYEYIGRVKAFFMERKETKNQTNNDCILNNLSDCLTTLDKTINQTYFDELQKYTEIIETKM